jgi:hypothetical protein
MPPLELLGSLGFVWLTAVPQRGILPGVKVFSIDSKEIAT